MEYVKKYKWLLILVCCVVIILLPIKFSNHIKTYAKIIPSEKLVAIKGSNGQIITHLINNFTGIVEDIKTIQVDREDFATFKVLNKTQKVAKNETLAIFSSSHTQYLYEEILGEILELEKLLNAQISGEKESIISEQQKIYEISKIDYLNQQKIYERKAKLFESELISQEEYDQEKNLVERLKLAQEKEQQTLITLKTGVKKEDVLVTKERIKLLKNQATILGKRIENYNIVSPFDGDIVGSSSIDTLFTISKNGDYVAIIPIEIEKLSKIQINQNVVIDELQNHYSLKIDKIDSHLKFINGKNYIIARSYITTDNKLFDRIYSCYIVTDEVTIKDLLIEKLKSIFSS